MSSPSSWPLPASGIRFKTPTFMVEKLARHPLTKDCYPTAMGYYPEAAGHRMERVRHDDNLLLYCTDGRGELHTPHWRGSVAAGQLMLLPQGLSHTYYADARRPWTLFWVHFQGISTGVLCQHLGYQEQRPVLNAGVSAGLIGAFNNLMDVRRTGYSSARFVHAANQLRQLLTYLAVEIGVHRGRTQDHFQLEHVQGFMHEHIDRSLSLDELAATARMSKFHFSNRYKQLTGYSPIKHFLHMKMEQACYLLDSSNLSVKAIGANLGYEDPLYFSRVFSKIVGQSPRSYRASIRK